MSLFSDRLVFARKKSGLTQQDIADHFNLTRSAYSAWEVGRNEPSFEILAQLCKKLEVSADYLIGLTDTLQQPTPVPISIPSSFAARDPFDDLTPEQRSAIELSLKAFREANAAKAQEA